MVDKLAPLDLMAIVTDDVDLLIDFTNDKNKLKKKLESLIERTKNDDGSPGFGPGQRLGKSVQYSAWKLAFFPSSLRSSISRVLTRRLESRPVPQAEQAEKNFRLGRAVYPRSSFITLKLQCNDS